jgi:lysyl-tRNA synthetase, class II
MSTQDELRKEREEKIAKLEASGMEPYPARVSRTHSIADARASFETLAGSKQEIGVAGRLMSVRRHGGSTFADIFDGTERIQLFFSKDILGEELYGLIESAVDPSDFLEAKGTLFTTKRGEQSIEVHAWRMLAKALQAVPSEWYGIKDEDERYRKRYLDILGNDEVRAVVTLRSKFWNTIRSFLLARGYVEVETPVLENVPGGADARPFITHHNALDIDVYLRISAGELWQKRLMVAGIPKTFEIGRIFRNEGMSHEHLQDYTQLEFYEAYSDYEQGMEMIQDLYRTIAQDVFGKLRFTIGEHEVDLSEEWKRYDYCALIREHYGIDPLEVTLPEVEAALDAARIPRDPGMNIERGVDLLWKRIRKSIAGPGFLVNVPVYLEPLAKRSKDDPRVVERFQVLLAGSEMGKGFSELNDPRDQRDRFLHQQALRDQGDDEAQMADQDYVEALEFGMPPTFGFGLSERLFSFLRNTSIREGQIFPLMRPRTEE